MGNFNRSFKAALLFFVGGLGLAIFGAISLAVFSSVLNVQNYQRPEIVMYAYAFFLGGWAVMCWQTTEQKED